MPLATQPGCRLNSTLVWPWYTPTPTLAEIWQSYANGQEDAKRAAQEDVSGLFPVDKKASEQEHRPRARLGGPAGGSVRANH